MFLFRSCLPAPMHVENDVGIWSILKLCVGKVRVTFATSNPFRLDIALMAISAAVRMSGHSIIYVTDWLELGAEDSSYIHTISYYLLNSRCSLKKLFMVICSCSSIDAYCKYTYAYIFIYAYAHFCI